MPNPTLRIALCVAVVVGLACGDPDPSSVPPHLSDGGLEDGALEQTSLASTAPGEPLSPVECRAVHPVDQTPIDVANTDAQPTLPQATPAPARP